jgi:hypothetical protein
MNVLMPQLGETVTEGTVANWHKKVGDKVAADEIILDIRPTRFRWIPSGDGFIADPRAPRASSGSMVRPLRSGACGSPAAAAAPRRLLPQRRQRRQRRHRGMPRCRRL